MPLNKGTIAVTLWSPFIGHISEYLPILGTWLTRGVTQGYWVTATGVAACQCALGVEIPALQQELNTLGVHQLEFAIDQGVSVAL